MGKGKPYSFSPGLITCAAIIVQLCGLVLCNQCYSFAGGSVYPQETAKSSGHNLQWTKAMSMWSQSQYELANELLLLFTSFKSYVYLKLSYFLL